MDRYIFTSFFLVLIAFSLESCSSMYMPNVPATPMFTKQGEGYLSGHINLKGNISGNAGVAITKHIGFIANGSYVNNKRQNEEFKQYLYEGGIGYFTPLGKSKRQVFEVYAGYGIGNTLETDLRSSTSGMIPVEVRDMDFEKMFVQVNYSSIKKDKINLFGARRELNYGTAIRLSRIAMKDFSIDNVAAPQEDNIFVEPVFFTRLALNKNWQLQYTTGFNIGVVSNEYLKAGNAVFTLGVSYNFGKNKK
ncbi:hypothetical protein [Sphingobacterium sp. SYP-B4668]|uniref:hypothetical protein n=1 Tax=Sphingobacterium sp. SYP-B4668 TaxID=2996035 RepID=UPI0022DDCF44|nr:hypothetical protein [Sphingobacterium sp. SYP-B4668]